MKIPVLDLKPQYEQIKEEIHLAINRVIESTQFIMGPDVKLFEQEVAEYLGTKHTIAVNSGTDALVIGLRSLGIGEGDEVITTPFSFFATAESISNVGAKPVFADVDPKSFNIDPKEIKTKITAKTKAIMPVHLYGNPAAMAQIMDIAQEHGLKVIEDCAQSFGAKYYGGCVGCQEDCQKSTRDNIQGKFTGTIGDVGAYSFFPSKNLGCYGDGGMVVTNDDKVAELAGMLRVHGSKKKYHNEIIGYNSRLDTLQAAVLRVKLRYIDQWNQGRRRVAELYSNLLSGVNGIVVPLISDGHVFHQYTVCVVNGQRDRVQEYLTSEGIGSMIYYPVPQDKLPVYDGQYGANSVSDLLAGEVLSLPIWPELELEKIEVVVQVMDRALS
ncbi:erythromycin biosynthesis sensory transduction protein eryC1 [Cylindrospermopsis raciborskii C04]|uniref:Erythromycin biosynthesis sensory transduction protein eryC1 n=1 Tax=Cylindrospermopsis raciborskii C07 TaxID=2014886 RepID=A0ABX4WLB0_9CYAN|nr:DegT/DnrJ/EryC1/StrS family aminotransferase [Cylindrospermopsis raciborskii]PNJ94634.1 erythromycin biosynthesis sensory transduction protein eryC1 [Cylindrospermopsis raciborskii C04]PNJ94829.1 erythromycin biosynthesis sensory transduction protein eryC1 [Cylindrospermopsis raciborskii C03]PNJ96625.1 erythromycin biosynthesis sensory transduction protein eryC1 [Cylindrospermopsis raciborskii C07]